jgi:hypothetical protein
MPYIDALMMQLKICMDHASIIVAGKSNFQVFTDYAFRVLNCLVLESDRHVTANTLLST